MLRSLAAGCLLSKPDATSVENQIAKPMFLIPKGSTLSGAVPGVLGHAVRVTLFVTFGCGRRRSAASQRFYRIPKSSACARPASKSGALDLIDILKIREPESPPGGRSYTLSSDWMVATSTSPTLLRSNCATYWLADAAGLVRNQSSLAESLKII